ncbi:mandelate racemase [Radicibacter daui]|uniref:mandelate racemase n=1 Tax=Radicibacter daui TaxID=3064829 RepID=UPI004046CF6C
MTSSAPTLRLITARSFERAVMLRLPFRFGVATLTEARQLFVEAEVEFAGGARATGYAAELMVPKWFDKNPALDNADNEAQLRQSLELAIAAMSTAGSGAAFALHARVEAAHHKAAAAEGLGGLIASFGLALIDRAMLDALCRHHGLPVAEAMRRNIAGIDATTAPDLAGFDIRGFLSRLSPAPVIRARHTVGFADALTAADAANRPRVGDGLPECLEDELAAYGLTRFKLKLSGQPDADTAHLKSIAGVLDRLPDYRATLDGNEQYEDEAALLDLLDRIDAEPALAALKSRLLFIEQPINRARALSASVRKAGARVALEIDESDGDIGAFPAAKAAGYTGISSKSCKGFYRALLNAMRAAKWNAEEKTDRYFLSAEDLTTQAGIAVQQDLALAALIGAGHVERNGHHYVDGMAGANARENAAFLAAHGDLYRPTDGRARLVITGGNIALGSLLAAPGLGVDGKAARAVFAALKDEDTTTTKIIGTKIIGEKVP